MGTAVIGYIHPGTVRAEFMASTLALVRRTRTSVDGIKAIHSGPNIARARNTLVREFLDTSTASWLLMVDTDMVFRYDLLDRLAAAANVRTRPIMGALCMMQETPGGEPLPTLYELAEGSNGLGFARYQQWPDNEVMPIAATGTGAVLVHRRVFVELADADSKTHDPAWPWFREATMRGRPVGEDLTFMMRAASIGIPVHVHTGIRVGHMKTTMLGDVA